MKRYFLVVLIALPLVLHAEDAIRISANSLYAAYEANEVAADDKYKEKTVAVSGKIQNIGKDILGSPFVIVGGTGMLDGVQCMFAKSSSSRLGQLSKGQSITVVGKCSGRVLGMQVLMSDCTLQ